MAAVTGVVVAVGDRVYDAYTKLFIDDPSAGKIVGVAMVGGTNAMAAVREAGHPVVTRALKGLIDIGEMGYLEYY